MDTVFQQIKTFVATLVCIAPCGFGVGTILSIPLLGLFSQLRPTSQERRKSTKKVLSTWPEQFVAALIAGLATFPLFRWVNGIPLTWVNYLVVAAGLLLFGFLEPVMAGKFFKGEDSQATNKNLYAFWAGLALGGLSGIFSSLLWFQ